jgi:aryl-alcohol dehydrogenase-like predicted oxidoreductase
LGTWQFGGDWGDVSEQTALDVLHAGVDSGVTLLDTADVYGDGRSEQIIGRFLREIGAEAAAKLTVITKMGRRAQPHVAEAYTYENFKAWTDRSRANLGFDTLPLVQLHCPPTAVYSRDSVYDALDRLVAEKAIAAYGVSVETAAEALTALEHPGVASIQIIANILRRKPVETVFPRAQAQGVGIIVRVPLASGLLTGKITRTTVFAPTDHRNYNRHGESFDVGETFSGVPFEDGVAAGAEMVRIAADLPGSPTPAQVALRWVVDQPGVTTVIPGASRPEQAQANAAAADLAPLSQETLTELAGLYTTYAEPFVADRW